MEVVGIIASPGDLRFAETVRCRLMEAVPDRACPVLQPEASAAASFGSSVPLLAIWSQSVSLLAAEGMAELLRARIGRAPGIVVSADHSAPPTVLTQFASEVLLAPDLPALVELFEPKQAEPAPAAAAAALAGKRVSVPLTGVFGALTIGALTVGFGLQSVRDGVASASVAADAAAAAGPVVAAEEDVTSLAAFRAREAAFDALMADSSPVYAEAKLELAPIAVAPAQPVAAPHAASLQARLRRVARMDFAPIGMEPLAVIAVEPLAGAPLEPLADPAPTRMAQLSRHLVPLGDAAVDEVAVNYGSEALVVASLNVFPARLAPYVGQSLN